MPVPVLRTRYYCVSVTTATPLLLAPNQPLDRPYRGGAGIARFRGTPQPSPFTPEDFVASTTEVVAGGGVGLAVLPDGRTLRDAVAADPVAYLGEEHVARFGPRTMLLVKLLDTAERLFVHYHPDDTFAARHLNSPLGKTEAWAVIEAEPGAAAFLGFRRPVGVDEVRAWWSGQDADAMVDAMNAVPLAAGDTLLVPAGLAHAIGPSVTLVELQQPTDLSILLERRMLTERDALLGLELETAIDGLTREVTSAERIAALRQGRGAETLFPGDADPFFSAERIHVSGSRELAPGFSVLVVLGGEGTLETSDGAALPLHRGATVLTAHADGPIGLSGELDLIRCRPPR